MAGPRPAARPPRKVPAEAPEGAPRLLVLVGPTASGKTALAIELAERLAGEVISADSQQVYRGLDIGTAKPGPEERARVPHHLLDVAEPEEVLSAGEFARRADQAIAEIRARGRLPVVVGGTGLWIRALLLGLMELPPPDLEVRARYEEMARREGREAVHALLARLDPETAAQTPPANLVRVVRALEIHAATGQRPSELRARHGFARLRYRAEVLGLRPPREVMYRRVDERAAAMFRAGLVDEVRALRAARHGGAPALKALGYPQAAAVLDGAVPVEAAVAQTALATRRYAKRQLTWFQADPLVRWLPWPPDAEVVARELAGRGLAGLTAPTPA